MAASIKRWLSILVLALVVVSLALLAQPALRTLAATIDEYFSVWRPYWLVWVVLGTVIAVAADRVRARLEQEPGLANVPGDSDRLPISVAAQFGQRDVAEVLIQHGAEVMLVQAAGLGMLDRIKTEIEKNSDSVNQVNEAEAPLFAASSNRHADVVRYLLAQGADVNLTLGQGHTEYQPIDSAKTATVIDLLANAGADVCHVHRGYTPLMRALQDYNKNRGTKLERRDEARIKVLVKHGGLRRFYMVGAWTRWMIEPLLELGADVNETDKNGETALHRAINKRDASEDPGVTKAYTQMIELVQKHGGRRGDES